MSHLLQGTGVALITPFEASKLVCKVQLKKLVEHVVNGGIENLVVLGTTSEAPTLDLEERILIANLVAEFANKKVKLILGIGGNDTQQAIKQLSALPTEYYDAILSVVPYYNRPTQAGLIAHFNAIAEESEKPLVLYNVPARTGLNMHSETSLTLANHKNIVGIKEASGNIQQCMEIIKYKPSHFELVSGDDLLTLPLLSCGAVGVISVIGNAFPEKFSKMVNFALNNNFTEARHLHFELYEIIQAIFEEGNPAGVKALLNLTKGIDTTVRLPLLPVSSELTKKLGEIIVNKGATF